MLPTRRRRRTVVVAIIVRIDARSGPSAVLAAGAGPSTAHHGWRSRAWFARLLARAATAPDAAAEHGEQKEPADAAADAYHELFVVVDPAADFFGCG